jgi:hypothetical protein
MLRIDYSNETITPEISFYDKFNRILIVNPDSLIKYEKIINNDSNCRYPNLTLRILIYIITEIDNENKWEVSPRQISKQIGANYDTVTKCLKYLRSIKSISYNN